MLFNRVETCVLNAGFSSSYFHPANGVRQGCCASPLLFVIAVELLAVMIRNNQSIQGIVVCNTEFKISQFADDTTCFVANRNSLTAVLNSIELFLHFQVSN